MRKLAVALILIVLVVALPVGAQPGAGATLVPKTNLPSPGTIRGFDPQPDPPAEFNAAPSTGLDEVGFNPQPEPPRIAGRLGDGSV